MDEDLMVVVEKEMCSRMLKLSGGCFKHFTRNRMIMSNLVS